MSWGSEVVAGRAHVPPSGIYAYFSLLNSRLPCRALPADNLRQFLHPPKVNFRFTLSSAQVHEGGGAEQ